MQAKVIHRKLFLKMQLSYKIFFIRNPESCIQRWLCRDNRSRINKINLDFGEILDGRNNNAAAN